MMAAVHVLGMMPAVVVVSTVAVVMVVVVVMVGKGVSSLTYAHLAI
jgi:hypothetical protein